MDNVKVAVRVRPYNSREKERDARCIIEMAGGTTSITNPDTGEVKSFSFDYSYWSHAPGDNFATQKVVFDDLGIGVLENAWQVFSVPTFCFHITSAPWVHCRFLLLPRCSACTKNIDFITWSGLQCEPFCIWPDGLRKILLNGGLRRG